MKRARRRPTPIGTVVRALIGDREGTPSGRRGGKTLKFFEAFARIGPPVSERAEPVAFKSGVLTLEVSESVWLTELSLLAPQIRSRLNCSLGASWVTQVRLRLGLPRRARLVPPLRPLTEAERQRITGWVASIRDPDVKTAFCRAAEHCVRRGLPRGGLPPGSAGPCLTPAEPSLEAPRLTYGYGWRRPGGPGDTK